jgi:hypothetical protein
MDFIKNPQTIEFVTKHASKPALQFLNGYENAYSGNSILIEDHLIQFLGHSIGEMSFDPQVL